MKLSVGTSGYSYKEWKGSFYPEGIKNDEMLSYYATQLSSVEINNTFYRMPRASVLDSWAAAVPESFRFTIKASRRITHMKRLNDVGEEMTYLLDTIETLGAKLGAVLIQLPPNFKKNTDRLSGCLDHLRPGTRAVFEFRHESWLDDDVYDLLREHGCALCLADVDDADEPDLIRTADWGYMRLRRSLYSADDLRRWHDAMTSQGWNEAFVYFKHEDGAAGPEFAKQFLALGG